MFAFLKSLFNPAPPSGSTAKERLRLVLLSDHLSLAPETVAALKAELLAVISRYVEIDPAHADVTFEHRENDVAMLASVPITGIRERIRPVAVADVAAAAVAVPAVAAPGLDVAEPGEKPAVEALSPTGPAADGSLAEGAREPSAPPDVASASSAAVDGKAAPATSAHSAAPATARRRRRKKAQAAARAAGATQLGKPAQA